MLSKFLTNNKKTRSVLNHVVHQFDVGAMEVRE
jgi:hypothetical protein